jgi:DNA-binding LacI/PurR family transcriptional regulator
VRTALYQQIYDDLRVQIETGQLAVGHKIPGLEQLANAHGVSTITVRKALDMLSADGLVVRRPRIGTVVVAQGSTSEQADDTSSFIGCVMTNYDDTFGTDLLSGIVDAAEGRAMVVMKRSLGSLEREEHAIDELVRRGARGLIVLPGSSHQIPAAVLRLAARQYPMVIVDRSFDSVPISTVTSNNFEGARLATEHLIELGHTHIGWLAPPAGISTVEDRHAGYIRAQAEHGVPYLASQELTTLESVVPSALGGVDEDLAGIDEFIGSHPEVTAYVVSEYNLALLLATACRRRSLEVGRDISVVCFDHPAAAFDPDRFTFSHIQQDQKAMAEATVAQVLAEIDEPGQIRKRTIDVQLVRGDSTMPPHG